MAITYGLTRDVASTGDKYEVRMMIATDASYPLGGYELNNAQMGLTIVESLVIVNLNYGYEYSYNVSTNRLQLGTPGSEFAPGFDVQSVLPSLDIVVSGR